MISETKANRILDKLGLGRLAPVESEYRRAAWENRDPVSIERRLIKVIEDNFAELSGQLDRALTPKELQMLKDIPSQISNLI